MGNAGVNLQDGFLNQACQDNLTVVVYLNGGSRLEGKVKGFDNFTLILSNNGRDNLIYKHAIATISPLRSSAAGNHHKGNCAGAQELKALAEKYSKK